MKKPLIFTLLTIVLALLIIAPWWVSSLSRPSLPAMEVRLPELLPTSALNEPIQPIPRDIKLDQRKVALGERLFGDHRLSRNNSTACTSCHILNSGGADNKSHSLRVDGKPTAVNTPTVFNTVLNFKLNWTGEFDNFEDHLDRVVKTILQSTWSEVISKLKQDNNYVSSFYKLYPDGMQVPTIKDALVAYERSLTTPNSRFDKFLRGNQQAINDDEKRGYQLFKSYGCVACHQGINVGGNMYQKFGVMNNYFRDRGHIVDADWGRFNLTRQEGDRHSFRVPSLRNVALTAPYFHDGTATTLNDAVGVMAKYQLGRPIPTEDVNSIVAFLRTLTGEFNGRPFKHE